LALEARKMARYEVETCRQFDRVVWVTRQDYEAVERQVPASGPRIPNSAVIPICGDPEEMPVVNHKADARRVTFLGGLHYLPNAQGVRWFAEQVFPLVSARVPDATFTVIGKNPPAAIQRLTVPTRNTHATRATRITVTGYVADPRPYLEETAAFVVPLLAGGGMRVKIVDAWCWGLPVVSTTVGAEGIACRDGENILIADDVESFARAVARVLREPDLARRLRESGRRWAEEHYDWRKVYTAWDQAYAQIGEG
jgi:glycosyltransferase involved in cell wall biosynthesis